MLTHDGEIRPMRSGHPGRRRLRRRPISRLAAADLPTHIPTMSALYKECGTGFELMVDVYDEAAGPAAVDVARGAHPGAPKRLWLCHTDWRVLARWREQFPDVHLVNSVRLRAVKEGAEKRAAQLAAAGIDAINLHYTEWSGGLTALFHRFRLLTFGWDAQHERIIRDLVRMGIDGVHSDHVDRLVAVLGRQSPPA